MKEIELTANFNEEKQIKQTIPLYEIIIYFCVFLIVSLIGSFYFLKYFIDKKKISKTIYYICYIYFTLFIFYQLLTNLDFTVCLEKDKVFFENTKFLKEFFENYYFYFNCLGLFLRFVFFPIYSGFLESGYIQTRKKFLDATIYHYIIVSIIIGVIIVGTIILIIFIDELIELYGDYGSLIINSINFIALIRIYLNVGFFIIHNLIDCRRKYNKTLNQRYNTYFKNLVLKAIKEDNEEMSKTYKKLSKEIIKSDLKTLEPNYFQYIFSLINKAKENKEIYKINFEEECNNKIFPSEIFEEEEDDKSNLLLEVDLNKKDSNNLTNDEKQKERISSFDIKEFKQAQNNNDNNDINKVEKELSPHIRNFKHYLRTLPKLKFILDAKEKKSKETPKCKKILLNIKYVIYYLAIIIILYYEYYCLKVKKVREKEASERKLEEDSEEYNHTVFEFIIGIFLSMILIFFNSFYTIAVFYSLYKRNIITGDLLYGKHFGDDLNLINTTKTIAGLAPVLAYCNLYIGNYWFEQHPALFDVVMFPEYDIGHGYNFIGVVKFIFLIVFGIISNSFEKIFCLRINDFGNSWKYLCLCKC
mgnify:CR=1 FL=1